MAEIAFLIIAIALAAFLIALIPTLLRTRHVVKEVEETVAVLRTDINAAGASVGKAGSAFAIGKVASKQFGKKDKKK